MLQTETWRWNYKNTCNCLFENRERALHNIIYFMITYSPAVNALHLNQQLLSFLWKSLQINSVLVGGSVTGVLTTDSKSNKSPINNTNADEELQIQIQTGLLLLQFFSISLSQFSNFIYFFLSQLCSIITVTTSKPSFIMWAISCKMIHSIFKNLSDTHHYSINIYIREWCLLNYQITLWQLPFHYLFTVP